MKPFLTLLGRLLSRHREMVWPLAAIVFAVLAIFGVHHLTGRPVIDDPGAIVGMLYTLIGLMLAALATGQIQQHLIGFRSERTADNAPPSMRDDLFDAVITLTLFWLCCSFIFK